MKTTTAAPLFQIGHVSGLHAVERELAAMHLEMLRRTGDETRSVRLSVLNLVAACTDAASAEIASETVTLIAADHPARAVIIVADRNGPDQIDADLTLTCSISEDGQICAEQVHIKVSGEPSLHLASVVMPLLVPDVPVFLWLVGAPPLNQALGQDAIAICERLIIDTGAYPDSGRALSQLAEGLGGSSGPRIADLAWARSRRWRELIAKAFDGVETRRWIRSIERVDIQCAGDRVSSQAWLLAGWLASRLEWERDSGPDVTATARAVEGVPSRDLVSVEIHCRDRHVSGLIRLERLEKTIHATTDVGDGSGASLAVPVSDVDTAHLVGSLIEDDSDDPIYSGALGEAARLARRTM